MTGDANRRRITFAGGDYDRTHALIEGTIKPDGLELSWRVLPYHDIWTRMLNRYEFDASELSLSSYLIARTMGKPLIAIPVFPARPFFVAVFFIAWAISRAEGTCKATGRGRRRVIEWLFAGGL